MEEILKELKQEKFSTIYGAENIYLVYDEDTRQGVLIDPGDDLPALREFLQEQDIHVEAILLTHGHGDHIYGVLPLAHATGAKIIAAEAEKDLLLDPAKNLSPDIIGRSLSITCNSYVQDGDRIAPFDIEVIACPGHTPGGVSYRIGDSIYCGDTVFRGSVGRWDLPGGDVRALRRSVKNLLANDPDITLYPGHGQATTIGEERMINSFYRDEN